MARKWSNQNLPGALHFVTGNVINRIPVCSQDSCCHGFFDILADLRDEWPCKLIAYVLMPDHIHLIVNPCDGDIKGFMGALKSRTAKRLVEITADNRFVREFPDADGSAPQVWQESFKAQPLWSAWMIWQKINYIHNNPVNAGLVTSAKNYRWSSFRAFYLNSTEPLAIDQDWWWPDDSEKLSKAMKALGWRAFEKRS
ncbi:MAG: REP-associated tyrosine transposase [Pyrinomonadaceae bacterium]